MQSRLPRRKLCERGLKEDFWLDLQALPTVCLLAVNDFQDEMEFKRLVVNLLAYDCRYFMTYGAAAEILHDKIDEVIFDLKLSGKRILTAVHAHEPADEVAWFFVSATAPEEDYVQYFFGCGDRAAFDELSCAIRGEVQRFNDKFGS